MTDDFLLEPELEGRPDPERRRALFHAQALRTPAFRDVLAFCSNMHLAPVFGYPSNEHAYVAAKTSDLALRDEIKAEPSPYKVKRFGRKLALRPDWDQIKLEVMETLVREKFTKHPALATQLRWTTDVPLVERNNWGDRFWGQVNGVGENHLGRLLMNMRAELIAREQDTPARATVVHCKQAKYDVYIGRGKCPVTGKVGTWGNPFSHLPNSAAAHRVATRADAVSAYRDWFFKQPTQMARAKRELTGKVLGCWCKPQSCHGDVLAAWVNS